MIRFLALHPAVFEEHLGLLPDMLSESDPRPAREQFNANYAHGGGWRPLPQFTMHDLTLHYPGDPPLKPIAMARLRDEIILLYDRDIVAIVQRDGGFEAARMD